MSSASAASSMVSPTKNRNLTIRLLRFRFPANRVRASSRATRSSPGSARRWAISGSASWLVHLAAVLGGFLPAGVVHENPPYGFGGWRRSNLWAAIHRPTAPYRLRADRLRERAAVALSVCPGCSRASLAAASFRSSS